MWSAVPRVRPNINDNSTKKKMAQAVSAFANSDGGQLIYGMTELDHEANGLDAGLNPVPLAMLSTLMPSDTCSSEEEW
jgi:predicted HTH transcriptional regulator